MSATFRGFVHAILLNFIACLLIIFYSYQVNSRDTRSADVVKVVSLKDSATQLFHIYFFGLFVSSLDFCKDRVTGSPNLKHLVSAGNNFVNINLWET